MNKLLKTFRNGLLIFGLPALYVVILRWFDIELNYLFALFINYIIIPRQMILN